MIMLIEDDDDTREITVGFIRSLGHQVADFANAEAASAALESLPIEVLVTDLGLPGTQGEVFAAEACSLRSGLRIVFLTGSVSIPDGIFDTASPILLRKPYDLDALEIALGRGKLVSG